MSRLPILLINPNLMKPPVTPISFDLLGEYLRREKYPVELLDLSFCENDEQVRKEVDNIKNKEYLLTAVTIRNIDDSTILSRDFILKKTKEIIDQVKKNTASPIIVGGVGYSIFPKQVLEYLDLEFGITGDGEIALLEFANNIEQDLDPSYIPGLVRRDGGKFISAPPRYISLTNEPPLSRDIVDNLRYFKEGGMVGWETKRGCSLACAYCADPVAKGRRIRTRSPKSSVEELAGFVKRDINIFHTCDSEFNVPEEHAIAICKEIIDRGLSEKIEWFAYCSPIPFSEELAKLMKKSGCKGINFTVDSASENLLRMLGKDHTKDDLFEITKLCKKNNIELMYDLLIGGIGETRETVKETIETMKELSPRCIGVSMGVRIYPDTVYGEQVHFMSEKEKQISLYGRDGSEGNFLKPVFYLSSRLGGSLNDICRYIKDLTGDDKRFFINSSPEIEGDNNYNYNNNNPLTEKINAGARGAFWYILSS